MCRAGATATPWFAVSSRFTALPSRGPLARLASRLSGGAAVPSSEPAAQLARLVDLAGSMKLSSLGARSAKLPRPVDTSARGETRAADVAAARRRATDEMEEIEADARAALTRVLRRRDDARTPEQRLADEAARWLVDGHRRMRALRRALGIDLSAASVAIGELDRVASAIDGAIDDQVEARLARLVPAACAAHTGDATSLAATLEEVLLAALAFDRRRIDALLDACEQLSVSAGSEARSA